MSSNSINYFDEPNFSGSVEINTGLGTSYNIESITNDTDVFDDVNTIEFMDMGDAMIQLNDTDEVIDLPGEVIEIPKMKYNPNTMTHQELRDYHIKLAKNKKKYIKKYQQTDKGKAKIKIASKKYYDKNRESILAKKREAYALKKKNKN